MMLQTGYSYSLVQAITIVFLPISLHISCNKHAVQHNVENADSMDHGRDTTRRQKLGNKHNNKKVLSLIYAATIAITVIKTMNTPIIYYVISLTTTMGIIGIYVSMKERENTALATVETFSAYLLLVGGSSCGGSTQRRHKRWLARPVINCAVTAAILVTTAGIQISALLWSRAEQILAGVLKRIRASYQKNPTDTAEAILSIALTPAIIIMFGPLSAWALGMIGSRVPDSRAQTLVNHYNRPYLKRKRRIIWR